MPEPLNILSIEDRNADFLLIERHLKMNGLSVHCSRVDTLDGLKEALDRESWDLVLSDYNVPQLNFLESLNLIRTALPDVPVILISGTVGEEKAVDLLKIGVWDFVLKDNLTRLVSAIKRCLSEASERKARVAAEEALRLSEERHKLALQGANDGLWDWNLKTNELYYSPRWKSMLGYADDELENRYENWERLLHPKDVKPTLTLVSDFLAARTPTYEAEYQMEHKDGHYVDILSRAFLLRDDQGQAARMVGTHVDISQRKKLEGQLRQALKMEAIGQLAGGVAHDFNNMLSVILGYAELGLMRIVPDDPLYRNLQEIRKAGESSADLTKQLLAFARKQDSVPKVIKLNDVISDQISMLKRLIGEDVRFDFRPSPDLWHIRIDPVQIDQILANLAVNARDAIGGVGAVSIETVNVTIDDADVRRYAGAATGDYVCFSFSDTGTGIDNETLERIFEPFFTTKGEGKGTGLGLSTIYGIVKQNNGMIYPYSEPGKGTTFKIYLPRFSGEVTDQVEKPKAVTQSGSETVLLVEDDEQILEMLRTILEIEGYVVIASSLPADACRICGEYNGDIDLLITDVVMPTMNGKELQVCIEEIKPGIRTLFMSGYTADIIAKRGVIDQGVNFISKPFSPLALAQKVRETIDR